MSKEEWQKWKNDITGKVTSLTQTINQLQKQDSPGKKDARTPQEITKENVDHVMDCPNCYPLVKAKIIEREFKDASHECVECGLPVKGEESAKEEWKCPGCEGTEAKAKD